MSEEVRARVESCLASFIETVVENEKDGKATPEELRALSEVAVTLMSC